LETDINVSCFISILYRIASKKERKLFLLIFLSVNSFFAWCARKYTITIISLSVGLLPLLRPTKTTEQTTQDKHVKEIVDAEATLGLLAFGLLFSRLFISKN
jgi:hypothetical protein